MSMLDFQTPAPCLRLLLWTSQSKRGKTPAQMLASPVAHRTPPIAGLQAVRACQGRNVVL